MTTKRKPYIGVTGYMSPQEVIDTANGIDFEKSDRLLMVGVLASQKTLHGFVNKWPGRYPKIDQIKEIFQEGDNYLNLVHYNTKDLDLLLSQILMVTEIAGPKCHGLQLNLVWPDPSELSFYYLTYPGKKIVLQVGAKAFEEVEHWPPKLAEKLYEYVSVIDYVLLDPSGGLGIPFNPKEIRQYLEELYSHNFPFGIGVAGGLSPLTLGFLGPLAKDFTDLSIDAEGRLRTVEDKLDVGVAREYIEQSLELFSVLT